MNRGTHSIIGIGTASVGCFVWHRVSGEEMDIWDFLLTLLGGYVGSILPDRLEPAVSPNHRDFAHSVTGGSSLVYLAIKVVTDTDVNPRIKWLCRGFMFGYASHLVSDATTPKGLSFIG